MTNKDDCTELKDDELTAVSGGGARPAYVCEECENEFPSIISFLAHNNAEHGGTATYSTIIHRL